MLAETGQILLLISFALALLQGGIGIYGAHALNGRMMAFADRAAVAQAVFLVSALLNLKAIPTALAMNALVPFGSKTPPPMLPRSP